MSSEFRVEKDRGKVHERKMIQWLNFRHVNSASLRRITPSTHVGRLSGLHFDIGFQLTQFPGKMVMERHGERSDELKMFEQIVSAHLQVTRTAVSSNQRGCTSAVGKEFGGGSMKNHGIKPSKLDNVIKSSAGTHQDVSRCITRECGRLRWQIPQTLSLPPAVSRGGKDPSRQGLTHTHTPCISAIQCICPSICIQEKTSKGSRLSQFSGKLSMPQP